jgi:hypothetical protein
VLDRFGLSIISTELFETCLARLLNLDLGRKIESAHIRVDMLVGNAAAHPDLLQRLPGLLRDSLVYQAATPDDERGREIRRRAFELIERVAVVTWPACQKALADVQEKHAAGADEASLAPQIARVKALAAVVESVASQPYFATGAFDARNGSERVVSDEALADDLRQRALFLKEGRALLEVISDLNIPSGTHHFIETLEYLVPADPRLALLLMARAVRGSSGSGYQSDSLAEDAVVRVAERYLSEFRGLLEEDSEARGALLDILDVFMTAGWPRVRRLIYRLDDVYR